MVLTYDRYYREHSWEYKASKMADFLYIHHEPLNN